MRFRRRRSRPLWFPNIGTELDSQTSFDISPAGRFFSILNINTALPSQTISTVLTFDQPSDVAFEAMGGVNPALADAMLLAQWESQSWRLRRVVGKFFAGAANEDTQANGPTVLLTAGIIVRTVDSSTGIPVLSAADQAVDTTDAIRDPWLWRRQWVLSPQFAGQDSGVTDALRAFPRTTADYGSVQDGPHLDQKTNRVIGPQERLILNITATMLPLPVPSITAKSEVHGYFDYRLLGFLMKSSNRRNASR